MHWINLCEQCGAPGFEEARIPGNILAALGFTTNANGEFCLGLSGGRSVYLSFLGRERVVNSRLEWEMRVCCVFQNGNAWTVLENTESANMLTTGGSNQVYTISPLLRPYASSACPHAVQRLSPRGHLHAFMR